MGPRRRLEGVKESRCPGEAACATKTSPVLALVGQTVSSALPACGPFFHSFLAVAGNRDSPTSVKHFMAWSRRHSAVVGFVLGRIEGSRELWAAGASRLKRTLRRR